MKPTHILKSIAFVVFLGLIYPCVFACNPGSIVKRPSDLNGTGVRVGTGLLTSSTFVSDTRLGRVTNIVWKQIEQGSGNTVGIAGQKLVFFTDTSGTVLKSIDFPSGVNTGDTGMPHLDFVDIDGDGTCEFLLTASNLSKALMLDHNGKLLWTYRYSMGIDDFACGDLNGDGYSESVFAMNGFGGLAMVDRNGVEQWLKKDDATGNCWHVEIIDTDNNGRPEIVHSNAAGNLIIRNSDGLVIKETPSFEYVSYFATAELPSVPGQVSVLQPDDEKIGITTFNGLGNQSLRIPATHIPNIFFAATARLDTSKPEYIAALIYYSIWDRAVLYLFDDQNQLVYLEVLSGNHSAIAAIPADNTGRESLLIGSDDDVLRYDM